MSLSLSSPQSSALSTLCPVLSCSPCISFYRSRASSLIPGGGPHVLGPSPPELLPSLLCLQEDDRGFLKLPSMLQMVNMITVMSSVRLPFFQGAHPRTSIGRTSTSPVRPPPRDLVSLQVVSAPTTHFSGCSAAVSANSHAKWSGHALFTAQAVGI